MACSPTKKHQSRKSPSHHPIETRIKAPISENNRPLFPPIKLLTLHVHQIPYLWYIRRRCQNSPLWWQATNAWNWRKLETWSTNLGDQIKWGCLRLSNVKTINFVRMMFIWFVAKLERGVNWWGSRRMQWVCTTREIKKAAGIKLHLEYRRS